MSSQASSKVSSPAMPVGLERDVNEGINCARSDTGTVLHHEVEDGAFGQCHDKVGRYASLSAGLEQTPGLIFNDLALPYEFRA